MEHNRPIGHTLVQLITGQCMVKLARTKKNILTFSKRKSSAAVQYFNVLVTELVAVVYVVMGFH